MSITIYPSQFNMREDGGYEQLPAIKGETGAQGVPGVGALPGGAAGQVPVKQSGTDYDVAWEDIEWTKVWENASPTSDFAAQDIAYDASGCRYLRFVFTRNKEALSTVLLLDAYDVDLSEPICNVCAYGAYNANLNTARRLVHSITATGAHFDVCSAGNGYLIPAFIYAR